MQRNNEIITKTLMSCISFYMGPNEKYIVCICMQSHTTHVCTVGWCVAVLQVNSIQVECEVNLQKHDKVAGGS